MAINKFCPALYVNDPNFPGAVGKVTEQVVNCYIEEDYDQPDGSPYAVRLCAMTNLKGTVNEPVELWVAYNLTPANGGQLARKMPSKSILGSVSTTAFKKIIKIWSDSLTAKAYQIIKSSSNEDLEVEWTYGGVSGCSMAREYYCGQSGRGVKVKSEIRY